MILKEYKMTEVEPIDDRAKTPVDFTWKSASKIFWEIVKEKSIMLWFAKIMVWILGALLGFGVSICLKWRDPISTVLLIVFGTEISIMVYPIIRDYVELKLNDSLGSDEIKQEWKLWIGLIGWKTTALFSFALGISIAFWVHIGLRWGALGTFLVLLFVQFIARELFLFTLLVLAHGYHWEHIKRPTFP